MDVLSLTTTAATVVLALLTAWYVRLTMKMLRQAEQARQPSVVVDLSMPDGNEVFFEIGNVGDRPAKDIKVQFKDTAPWSSRDFDRLPLFSTGIAYLAPGRRFRYLGGFLDWEKLSDKGGSLEFTVTYRNEAGENFKSRARFDLRQYTGVQFSTFGHPTDAIARELSAMRMDKRVEKTLGPSRMFKAACPFCDQSISSSAKKCHLCHEMLTEGWASHGAAGSDDSSDGGSTTKVTPDQP